MANEQDLHDAARLAAFFLTDVLMGKSFEDTVEMLNQRRKAFPVLSASDIRNAAVQEFRSFVPERTSLEEDLRHPQNAEKAKSDLSAIMTAREWMDQYVESVS